MNYNSLGVRQSLTQIIDASTKLIRIVKRSSRPTLENQVIKKIKNRNKKYNFIEREIKTKNKKKKIKHHIKIEKN